MNFIAAIAVGGVILPFLPFFTFRGPLQWKIQRVRWMLTLVTTLVMCVIGNNIALSLGMVGALSIVRFRTAIKDARDTAYIFGRSRQGICLRHFDFMIAVLGSVVIFLLMLVLGNIQGNNRYLLIVREEPPRERKSNRRCRRFTGKSEAVRKNSARESGNIS